MTQEVPNIVVLGVLVYYTYSKQRDYVGLDLSGKAAPRVHTRVFIRLFT